MGSKTRTCSACGEAGHYRVSRKCPANQSEVKAFEPPQSGEDAPAPALEWGFAMVVFFGMNTISAHAQFTGDKWNPVIRRLMFEMSRRMVRLGGGVKVQDLSEGIALLQVDGLDEEGVAKLRSKWALEVSGVTTNVKATFRQTWPSPCVNRVELKLVEPPTERLLERAFF